MFTDQEVLTAMESLVAEKGDRHTASLGKYMGFDGKGSCFLGALAEHLGLAIPSEGTKAPLALGMNAVSYRMGIAFCAAQLASDARLEWARVIKIVRAVLADIDERTPRGFAFDGCQCGCSLGISLTKYVTEEKMLQAKERAAENAVEVAKMTGGYITGPVPLVPTACVPEHFISVAHSAKKKQDHALTA